ncbi:putative retrotransposon ty1-copia subclass protein [Tanacetum coccineum]
MDGNVHTFKARLVAKGFTKTYGVDYGETFSPVAKIRAIRILLAIAAFYDYKIWKMDVKTAFLNGHLSEDVYMLQPEGFVDPKHPNKAQIRRIFLDGYGVLDVRTVIFKCLCLSSRMRHDECLFEAWQGLHISTTRAKE